MMTVYPIAKTVMAALEAAIQPAGEAEKLWMDGSSPAMTEEGRGK